MMKRGRSPTPEKSKDQHSNACDNLDCLNREIKRQKVDTNAESLDLSVETSSDLDNQNDDFDQEESKCDESLEPDQSTKINHDPLSFQGKAILAPMVRIGTYP